MKYRKTRSQVSLYVRSMGKLLEVHAIVESDAEANQLMERHDELAVIACVDGTVILGDRHDHGLRVAKDSP